MTRSLSWWRLRWSGVAGYVGRWSVGPLGPLDPDKMALFRAVSRRK